MYRCIDSIDVCNVSICTWSFSCEKSFLKSCVVCIHIDIDSERERERESLKIYIIYSL